MHKVNVQIGKNTSYKSHRGVTVVVDLTNDELTALKNVQSSSRFSYDKVTGELLKGVKIVPPK